MNSAWSNTANRISRQRKMPTYKGSVHSWSKYCFMKKPCIGPKTIVATTSNPPKRIYAQLVLRLPRNGICSMSKDYCGFILVQTISVGC